MILSIDFRFNFADDRNIPVFDFFTVSMTENSVLKNTKQRSMQFLHGIFINSNQTFSFHILVTINLSYPF